VDAHPKIHGLVSLTLSNKDKKNAFTKDFIREFNDLMDYLHSDSSIRCLIIQSTVSKVFCAGADLKERMAMTDDEVEPFVSLLRSTLTKVASLPYPTLAAMEGVAFGGGLELALACDIRIAGSDAQLGLTETSLAVIPGAGGTQRLSRLIGASKAKQLIFTAARLTAEEAYQHGIVNQVVPVGTATEKAEIMASQIVERGPMAVRMAKLAVDKGLQVDIASGLEIEKLCYDQVIYTSDRKEGLKAFVEKRKPEYSGE
jgi:methylglutaconyl-CoA hydratase